MSSRAKWWTMSIPLAIAVVGALLFAHHVYHRDARSDLERVRLEKSPSGAKPARLSPDALPERVVGAPVVNRYLSAPLEPTDEDVRRLIESVSFDHWYGVYVRKRKVGFAREVMRKTAPGEPGGYFSSIDIAMRAGFGAQADVSFECEATYHATEPPFRLVAVRSLTKSSASEVTQEFTFDERAGTLTEVVDGKPGEKRPTSPTKDNLRGLFASTVAGPERVRVGQGAEYPSFDTEQRADTPMILKVAALADRHVDGVAMPVATLSVHFPIDKLEGSVVVARGGRPLEASIDEGMELRPEPRDIAIAP
jgi:hypothetical protein